jgi:hypothetical protein
MRERWGLYLHKPTSILTLPYLQNVFPLNATDDNLYINGAVFATKELVNAITQLQTGEKLVKGDTLIAARSNTIFSFDSIAEQTADLSSKEYNNDIKQLANPWDIFSLNEYAINADYELLTMGRRSAMLPNGITVTGNRLFIEDGAKIQKQALCI